MRTAVLLLVLAGCTVQPPRPPFEGDCGSACENLRSTCPALTEPDTTGASCEEACRAAQEGGLYDPEAECLTHATSCEAADACFE